MSLSQQQYQQYFFCDILLGHKRYFKAMQENITMGSTELVNLYKSYKQQCNRTSGSSTSDWERIRAVVVLTEKILIIEQWYSYNCNSSNISSNFASLSVTRSAERGCVFVVVPDSSSRKRRQDTRRTVSISCRYLTNYFIIVTMHHVSVLLMIIIVITIILVIRTITISPPLVTPNSCYDSEHEKPINRYAYRNRGTVTQ